MNAAAVITPSIRNGNGLNDWNTYTLDHELDVLGVYDGAASVISRSHTRTDALNLTNVWDNVTAANNQSYWSNPANRLQNASGAWGAKTFYYDGVGNRTQEVSTPNGGATTTDTLGYAATNNRVASVTRPGLAARNFTYDNAGNILTDNGGGGNKTYTYNKRNRLSVATVGALTYTYTTNALEQLAIRVQSSPAATTHFIHDRMGNVIAETAGGGATGATGATREYIYLYETEIAPTMGSRTVVDRPLAVVSAVNTASPATYWVSVDHLNRPVKMTNAAKASVWDAIWQPWGGIHTITGSASLDARFPGQWYQAETGLHYNWHRSYDPTLGRYTQPDPLGFVDGPSVYGYAGGSPMRYVDRDGRFVIVLPFLPSISITAVDIGIGLGLGLFTVSQMSGDTLINPPSAEKKSGVEEWNKNPPENRDGWSCRYVMYFPTDMCKTGKCPWWVTGRGWGGTLPEAMFEARSTAQSQIPVGCGHQHHAQMWCRKGNQPPFHAGGD